jgi:HEAT repeat protein
MPKEDRSGKGLTEQEIEQLLKSNNLLEKFKAVELLKERKSLDRLLGLIFSESWHLREKVQEALSQFSLNELADKLIPLLDEKIWYVRAAAINILGNLATKELENKSAEGEAVEQEETSLPKGYERIGELFDIIIPHLLEKNEVVRAKTAKSVAQICTLVPYLKGKLSSEQHVIVENQLREMKEFEILQKFLNL